MFGKKWVEIFFQTDYEKFLKLRNLLEENGIPCKTKTEDNAERISINNMNGRGPALSRDGFIKNYYHIFVHPEDTELARGLMQENC